jgi:hypothetical protein
MDAQNLFEEYCTVTAFIPITAPEKTNLEVCWFLIWGRA